MVDGVLAILYCKFGAVMEASETEGALGLGPNGVAICAVYGMGGTLTCTEFATNTLVFYDIEVFGFALIFVSAIIPFS
jgi:hypothetical protein